MARRCQRKSCWDGRCTPPLLMFSSCPSDPPSPCFILVRALLQPHLARADTFLSVPSLFVFVLLHGRVCFAYICVIYVPTYLPALKYEKNSDTRNTSRAMLLRRRKKNDSGEIDNLVETHLCCVGHFDRAYVLRVLGEQSLHITSHCMYVATSIWSIFFFVLPVARRPPLGLSTRSHCT